MITMNIVMIVIKLKDPNSHGVYNERCSLYMGLLKNLRLTSNVHRKYGMKNFQ